MVNRIGIDWAEQVPYRTEGRSCASRQPPPIQRGEVIERRKNKSVYKTVNNAVVYLLMTPWLMGLVGMWLIPAAISMHYSFTNFNLLNQSQTIGPADYIRVFTQGGTFIQALKVIFTYVPVLVPLRLAFALFVTMLLNKKHAGLGLYRTLYCVPSIIGGSIAISVVWKQIFGSRRVVTTLLSLIGTNQTIPLLGSPRTALGVIMLMGAWQFDSPMPIFLSALKQIPFSLRESVVVDGVRPGYTFLHITLPVLTPTIFFSLTLQIINGFRVFTESYVVADGGPLDSTLSYVPYPYHRAFTYFDMGYSCVLAWILVAIITVFTVIIFKTQKNRVYYESEEE